MKTTIEYRSKLAIGDEITFYLDGEKFVGRVRNDGNEYWIDCSDDSDPFRHEETVAKIFSHFGVSDRYEFRRRVIGRDWEGINGIWPFTSSLEELRKMLDNL